MGVAGCGPGRPSTIRPRLWGWSPSASLQQYPLQDRGRVEVVRERKLDRDASTSDWRSVRRRRPRPRALGGGGWQTVVMRANPGLDGVAVLDANVGLGRRVIADVRSVASPTRLPISASAPTRPATSARSRAPASTPERTRPAWPGVVL